jgi:hypothetical protein
LSSNRTLLSDAQRSSRLRAVSWATRRGTTHTFILSNLDSFDFPSSYLRIFVCVPFCLDLSRHLQRDDYGDQIVQRPPNCATAASPLAHLPQPFQHSVLAVLVCSLRRASQVSSPVLTAVSTPSSHWQDVAHFAVLYCWRACLVSWRRGWNRANNLVFHAVIRGCKTSRSMFSQTSRPTIPIGRHLQMRLQHRSISMRYNVR